MGHVIMSRELGSYAYSDGYHDCKITFFLYCDRCGSFGIREYRSRSTWIGTVAGLIVAVLCAFALLGWLNLDQVFQENGFSPTMQDLIDIVIGLIALVLCGFIAVDLFITLVVLMTGTTHTCRRCGNTDITDQNPLGYPEESWAVINVPLALTHSHYEHTYA